MALSWVHCSLYPMYTSDWVDTCRNEGFVSTDRSESNGFIGM